MKKEKAVFLFLNYLLLAVSCFSQNLEFDSLILVSNTAKEDSVKVNVLNNLFLQFEYADAEKAKEHLNRANSLAEKIEHKKGH